jgi:hypothetical protein
MAKYVIEDTTLTNTANAIRKKTGKTHTITPSNFATEIASIETGGGGSTVTKGIIINEFNSDGYATDVSVVGMTEIPNYYFGTYTDTDYTNALNKYLKEINLPSNLTRIGDYAFQSCSKLALTNLPNEIIDIGKNAFYLCSNLALTSLPERLTTINDDCFRSCSKLALTNLPEGLTSIGNTAFYACSKLALTNLPEGLTSIGVEAFGSCIGLTIIKIPSNVTTINDSTFSKCSNLKEITFLGNLVKINSKSYGGVFNDCSKLTKVILQNVTTVPQLGHTRAFKNTPIESGTGYIYVPDGLVDSFKSATNWSTYAAQIKPISELEAST